MAAISNTIQTFDRKGLRENLTDAIYDISPIDTPFMSNAGRADMDAVLHEWQTDSLAAVDTANAQIQGNDYTSFASAAATVRVGNYSQISAKTAIVAGTVKAVKKAGRADEMAYQIAKRGKELKRDMEAIALTSQGGSSGNSSTASKTAALLAWLKTNTNFYTTDGADPTWTSGVPSAARTDGGTLRAFTETILQDVCVQGYQAGANFSTLMVGPVNKQRVSTFTGIATKTIQQTAVKAAAIIGAADFYVSDFGTLAVIPNRFQRERDAWFLDFDYVDFMFLRKFMTENLAKTGDADKKLVLVEWGLKVKQEAALGGAFDLTTT